MLLPSGRVMLSANAIGDVNAHHRIRHRARHSLRGGVASPLQRFAPVVPRRRPRRPRMSRAGQARHVSCKYPALPARPERLRLGTTHSVVGGSRLPCGTCTAPIPIACASGGQAGCLHLLPQALSGTSHRPSIPPQAGKRHALSVTHPMALPSSFHPQQHPVFSSSSAPPAQTHPHTRFLNIHTRASRGIFQATYSREKKHPNTAVSFTCFLVLLPVEPCRCASPKRC
jgi:hypothetical protein